MLNSRIVQNFAILLVSGLAFPGCIVLMGGYGDFWYKLSGFLTAQFQYFFVGSILNPASGVAVFYVLVAMTFQDTARGRAALLKMPAKGRKVLETMAYPPIAMGVAAVVALVLQTVNSNIWALLSLFPMVQVLTMLGIRKLRAETAKNTF